MNVVGFDFTHLSLPAFVSSVSRLMYGVNASDSAVFILVRLLVSAGLARIYGTRTPLPDSRDSRIYLARLYELEMQAKAARRGACPTNTTAPATPDPLRRDF
jgi:hypothetical protein